MVRGVVGQVLIRDSFPRQNKLNHSITPVSSVYQKKRPWENPHVETQSQEHLRKTKSFTELIPNTFENIRETDVSVQKLSKTVRNVLEVWERITRLKKHDEKHKQYKNKDPEASRRNQISWYHTFYTFWLFYTFLLSRTFLTNLYTFDIFSWLFGCVSKRIMTNISKDIRK